MNFQSPLLPARAAARPVCAAARVLVRPAARALPGRVHEPRRARLAWSRRSGDRCGAGSRSCSSCSRSPFASTALARPRTHVSVPPEATRRSSCSSTSPARCAPTTSSRRASTPRSSAMRTFLDRLPKRFKVGLVSFSTEPEVLRDPTRDRGSRSARRSTSSRPRPAPRSATGSASAVAGRSVARDRRRAAQGKDGSCPPRSCCSPTARRTAGVLSRCRRPSTRGPPGSSVYTVALGTTTERRVRLVRLRALRELDPGAARSRHDRGDRARDRRQDLPRRARRSCRASTSSSARASGAALDARGHVVVRRRGRAAPARLARRRPAHGRTAPLSGALTAPLTG